MCRSEPVKQNPNLHTLCCFFAELLQKLPAGLVAVDNVTLQMNVVFSGADGLQHQGIRFVAAGKRYYAVSIEERVIWVEGVDGPVQFAAKFIFDIGNPGAEVEVPYNERILGYVLGIPAG